MGLLERLVNATFGPPRACYPVPLVRWGEGWETFVSLFNVGASNCYGEYRLYDANGDLFHRSAFRIRPLETIRLNFREVMGNKAGSFEGCAVLFFTQNESIWPYVIYRKEAGLIACTHLFGLDHFRSFFGEKVRAFKNRFDDVQKWSFLFLPGISLQEVKFLTLVIQNPGDLNLHRPARTVVRLNRSDGESQESAVEIKPNISSVFRVTDLFPDASNFLNEMAGSLIIPTPDFFLAGFHFNEGSQFTCNHMVWYRGLRKS